MKLLILFFALVYSSCLFAGDNLENKSIVCAKIDKDKEINIVGYYFRNDTYVWVYVYDEERKKFLIAEDGVGLRVFTYETTPSKIKIKEVYKTPYIEIDRETLQITWIKELSNKILFEGNSKNCSVLKEGYIDNELNKVYKKLKKEITKKNKI